MQKGGIVEISKKKQTKMQKTKNKEGCDRLLHKERYVVYLFSVVNQIKNKITKNE